MLCLKFLVVKVTVDLNRFASSIYHVLSFLIVAYRLTPLWFERLDWVRLHLDFDNFSFQFLKRNSWVINLRALSLLCLSMVRLKTLKWFLFLQNSPSKPFTGTQQFSYQLIIVIRIWPEISTCDNNKDPY